MCCVEFEPRSYSLHSWVCSRACEGIEQRYLERQGVRGWCSEAGCGEGVRARGVCAKHYKQLRAAEDGWPPTVWTEARKNRHHARRALMRGNAVGAPVTVAALLERDGEECGICGEAIDLDLEHPDPLSKSIDHVIPISKGGEHSLTNCQLAHLGCNVRKSNKLTP